MQIKHRAVALTMALAVAAPVAIPTVAVAGVAKPRIYSKHVDPRIRGGRVPKANPRIRGGRIPKANRLNARSARNARIASHARG